MLFLPPGDPHPVQFPADGTDPVEHPVHVPGEVIDGPGHGLDLPGNIQEPLVKLVAPGVELILAVKELHGCFMLLFSLSGQGYDLRGDPRGLLLDVFDPLPGFVDGLRDLIGRSPGKIPFPDIHDHLHHDDLIPQGKVHLEQGLQGSIEVGEEIILRGACLPVELSPLLLAGADGLGLRGDPLCEVRPLFLELLHLPLKPVPCIDTGLSIRNKLLHLGIEGIPILPELRGEGTFLLDLGNEVLTPVPEGVDLVPEPGFLLHDLKAAEGIRSSVGEGHHCPSTQPFQYSRLSLWVAILRSALRSLMRSSEKWEFLARNSS